MYKNIITTEVTEITQIIFFSAVSMCSVANFESLYLSFCGSGTTEESQLPKFQDIEYKIFTLYSQDNSMAVAGQGKKPKTPKIGLTNTKGLSIMTVEKQKTTPFVMINL